MLSEELSGLPLVRCKRMIVSTINALGGQSIDETPAAPDPDFANSVVDWSAAKAEAVLYTTLAEQKIPQDLVRRNREGVSSVQLMTATALRIAGWRCFRADFLDLLPRCES